MAIITTRQKKIQIITIALFYLLIIAGLIIYFIKFHSHVGIGINGTYIQTPHDIDDFHLIDQDGMPLTKKRLKGHWTMVFFGFTHCPMICPTTLAMLNEMYQKLEKDLSKNQLPSVIFISVDPERDTVKQLKRFVHAFNPYFIGARASLKATSTLERQFHLGISNDNPLNHSMEILLLNPDVRVQAYFAYPHQAERMATDYKQILIQNVE